MRIPILLITCWFVFSCNKNDNKPSPQNGPIDVTVKPTVDNWTKTSTDKQEYWRVGILFNTTTIKAKGQATVSWYFPAGWINGNPSNHYKTYFKFIMDGTTNGYHVFTDWKVDYTMRADSVKITDFKLDSGNYNVTIVQ